MPTSDGLYNEKHPRRLAEFSDLTESNVNYWNRYPGPKVQCVRTVARSALRPREIDCFQSLNTMFWTLLLGITRPERGFERYRDFFTT
jgi:hypothetical protein